MLCYNKLVLDFFLKKRNYIGGKRTDFSLFFYKHFICPRFGHKYEYWNLIARHKCRRCLDARIEIAREALDDKQKMKLSWYRNEAKWKENIRNRKVVFDNYGRPTTVITDGRGNIRGAMPK